MISNKVQLNNTTEQSYRNRSSSCSPYEYSTCWSWQLYVYMGNRNIMWTDNPKFWNRMTHLQMLIRDIPSWWHKSELHVVVQFQNQCMLEAEQRRENHLLAQPVVHNTTYFHWQIQSPTSVSYYKTKIIFIAGYDFSFLYKPCSLCLKQ